MSRTIPKVEVPREKPEKIYIETDDFKSGLAADGAVLRTEGVYECVVVAVYSPDVSYVGHFSNVEKSSAEEPNDKHLHDMLDQISAEIDVSSARVWIVGAATITEAISLQPNLQIQTDPDEIDDFSFYSEAVRLNFTHASQAIRQRGFQEDNINEHMSGNNEVVAIELDPANGRLSVEARGVVPDPSFTFTKQYFDFKLRED